MLWFCTPRSIWRVGCFSHGFALIRLVPASRFLLRARGAMRCNAMRTRKDAPLFLLAPSLPPSFLPSCLPSCLLVMSCHVTSRQIETSRRGQLLAILAMKRPVLVPSFSVPFPPPNPSPLFPKRRVGPTTSTHQPNQHREQGICISFLQMPIFGIEISPISRVRWENRFLPNLLSVVNNQTWGFATLRRVSDEKGRDLFCLLALW